MARDSRLPLRLSASLGSALGEVERWLDPAGRRAARQRLAAAFPSLTKHERERLLRLSYRRRRRLAALDSVAAHTDPVLFCRRLHLEGWERFESAESAGRGSVAVVLAIGRPRTALRALTLYRSSEAATGRRLTTLLQPATETGAIELPFLGRAERFPGSWAEAALAAGAPALPVVALPAPDGAKVTVGEPQPGRGSPADLVAALAACLEAEVRAHPELWPWMGRAGER